MCKVENKYFSRILEAHFSHNEADLRNKVQTKLEESHVEFYEKKGKNGATSLLIMLTHVQDVKIGAPLITMGVTGTFTELLCKDPHPLDE